jgi:hypothetical protein
MLNGFADTDTLFGYPKKCLSNVSIDDWLMLLMRIMIMEFNGILFARRYRLQWGLKDALVALRTIELTPPPKPGEPFNHEFHHSFYLATHIVYVQSAYNAIKANEREIPWLYKYVRQSFRYWMRQVKEYRKELKQGGTPSTYIDIDGIAEVCDCLRGAGLTEASDPMLCEGTLFMLSMQRKHGDWPAIMFGDNTPEASLDYYHRIHPTWVCTQSLRDRDFKIGAGANMFWCAPFTAAVHRPPSINSPFTLASCRPQFVAKVIKESNFSTLAYKPSW